MVGAWASGGLEWGRSCGARGRFESRSTSTSRDTSAVAGRGGSSPAVSGSGDRGCWMRGLEGWEAGGRGGGFSASSMPARVCRRRAAEWCGGWGRRFWGGSGSGFCSDSEASDAACRGCGAGGELVSGFSFSSAFERFFRRDGSEAWGRVGSGEGCAEGSRSAWAGSRATGSVGLRLGARGASGSRRRYSLTSPSPSPAK